MMDIRAVGSEGWKNRTVINYKFEVPRGNEMKMFSFTCANLPLMNPFDWFNIFWLLKRKKEVEKYKHYLQHIKLMIKC